MQAGMTRGMTHGGDLHGAGADGTEAGTALIGVADGIIMTISHTHHIIIGTDALQQEDTHQAGTHIKTIYEAIHSHPAETQEA